MCTREEVKLEVEAGERRIEAKMESSHMAIAKSISNLMGDVNEKLDGLTDTATASIIDRNSVHDSLSSINKTMNEVLEQTKKTNGRVSNLENWRAYILGAVAVLTALVLPIVFMVVNEIISHIKIGA
jgi:hypothetical protein